MQFVLLIWVITLSRWRVIRSQLLDKSYKFPEVIKPEAKDASDSWGISGADDWGVADADDWGDDGGDQKEGRRIYLKL